MLDATVDGRDLSLMRGPCESIGGDVQSMRDDPSPSPDSIATIVNDRAQTYGHPTDNFARIAAIWGVVIGVDITSEQVGLCLIGLKVAREVHRPTPDGLDDIEGYARCLREVRRGMRD